MVCLKITEETEDETEFAYVKESGKGPKEWGKIHPEWKTCDNGDMQSPIDVLNTRVEVMHNLGKLKRDYQPSNATVKNRGHDIMVRWIGDAGSININGTKYNLKQCHWHSPSEHTFNGSRHQLELHMVHESSDGKMAVVGITYKHGRPDSFLEKIIPHITEVGTEERDIGVTNPGDIKVGSRKYYRYIGSLTVPPCTEGIIWTIVKKVRTTSKEQVAALREAVHDNCETNSRPIQQKKGRKVMLYTP
ncbi:Alpha carbonic anhydrase [Thalictrum thalictroides]|uniref:carbonic anhydrase n=1 Tax=Thalictrum thalictroides TaxID=46969 RepID=A0A7J6V080_THATH|nr:Alpha carbonic anhydrase [Thalictrum thalictroides]